jgi:hypothetical protein
VYEEYVAHASAEVQASYRDAQAAAQSEKGIRLTDRTRMRRSFSWHFAFVNDGQKLSSKRVTTQENEVCRASTCH